MNYLLQKLFDWTSYMAVAVSAATNWDTIKGNASFILAFILTATTLYCRYLEIRDRRRKKKENE
jgi:uncharacterized membrane protein (DUF485 family)